MGERGKDMQQRSTGRLQTPVAGLGLNGSLHALPGKSPGSPLHTLLFKNCICIAPSNELIVDCSKLLID